MCVCVYTIEKKNNNKIKSDHLDSRGCPRTSVLFCMILCLGNLGNVGKNLGKIQGPKMYIFADVRMHMCNVYEI
jgi:hypothetical protein